MAKHLRGSKQIISLSIDAPLMERVNMLADAKGLSRSAMIERLIEEAIEQEEMATAAFANPVVAQAIMQAFMNPKVAKEVAKSMVGGSSPAQMEMFHRGIQLMNNYSQEWQKDLPPEVRAKNAVKKTMKDAKKRKPKAK